MFYLLVGLWLAACAIACFLSHLRHGTLTITCPCVAIAGFALTGFFYLTHQPYIAVIFLIITIYLTVTILWSLRMQDLAREHA